MSAENKAALRRFYKEVFEGGDLSIIDKLAKPNFVDHQPAPGQAPGPEGVRQFVTQMRAGLSNVRVEIEHILAEDDLVSAHVTIRGTHTGDLMGMPPSGKDVSFRVGDVVRFENGKAAERWGVEDMSGLGG